MSLLSTPAEEFDCGCASQDIQPNVWVFAYRRPLGPGLIAWQGDASRPVHPGGTSDNGRVRGVSFRCRSQRDSPTTGIRRSMSSLPDRPPARPAHSNAGGTNGGASRRIASGRLMTARQVAELLDVPQSWVYEQSRAGRIPTVTLGRYRRYRREAIEAWLIGLERAASGPGRVAR